MLGAGDDPAPVIAGTVEPAERASLDAERVRALHLHRAVIGIAAVAAVDIAGPLRVGLRLHVDQHRLAPVVRGVDDIAAQRAAASGDAQLRVQRNILRRPDLDARELTPLVIPGRA